MSARYQMFPVADELFSENKTYDLSIVVSDNEDFLTTIMEKL